MSLELKGYEKYQLEWMIEHGYSLEDLMGKIAEIINKELAIDTNAHVFIDEAFEILKNETGFRESEIWACKEEWEDNEGTLLWNLANAMLIENPYLNYGKHKDLISMCVSEYDSCDGEYVFYIEKEWLYEYAKLKLDINDVDYWLRNEYTSDESEPILFEGIKAGVVAGIYK